MNKREKIIISIAGFCAIAYAVYFLLTHFLLTPPAGSKVATDGAAQEISTPVGDANNDLVADAEGIVDKHIKARAETAWVKNPFWDRKSSAYQEWAALQRTASGGTATSKIIYSGYIDAGKLKMAIINGLEYRTGEQLEMEGYILERVTPSQVLIVNKNSGSEVAIPIQE